MQAKRERKKSAVKRARCRTAEDRGTAILSFVKAQNTPTTQKRGHSNQDSRHQEQQQSSRRQEAEPAGKQAQKAEPAGKQATKARGKKQARETATVGSDSTQQAEDAKTGSRNEAASMDRGSVLTVRS